MKTVRFGRTNMDVSTIGLGTWAHGGPKIVNGRPVGWFGSSDGSAKRSLLLAAERGITHWDTADVYGDGKAEQLIGEIWGDVERDSIFLASKVGWDAGPHDHYYHPEQMRRQLERSLENLRTDRIDLYYLHHCDFGPEDEFLDDAIETVRRFREEGKIRWIGLSDWKTQNIRRYAEPVDPDVVQCYRNVVDDTYASSGLKTWVDEHDVGVAFFSPLKHALLLGKFEGPVTFGEGDHRNALQDFRDIGLLTRLKTCRKEVEKRFAEHQAPTLHALIGALLTDASTGSALLGMHRPAHIEQAATAGLPLEPDEARWVHQMYQENGKPTRASWKSFHPGSDP